MSWRVQPRREFLWSLALSVAIHAAVLALLLTVALPHIETPQPFQVEILPPQPLPSAPAAVVAAPQEPAPVPRVKRQPSPEFSRAPSATPAPAPAQAPAPEPPMAVAPAGPADSARVPAAEPAGQPRTTETSSAPAFTPPGVSANYLRNPPPRYPVASRRNGEQGTVLLKVLVSREGAPLKVEVEKSSGWPTLDRAALEAVRDWRFTPARRGQEVVEAPVLVPMNFRLDDGG